MQIKFLVDEDIANYYKTSMFIGFPHCSFKCDLENKCQICQNSKLATDPNIEIEIDEIIRRYVSNPLTHAIVIGGLEPFDDFDDLLDLVKAFRENSNDDIVIYTGYYLDEIMDEVEEITKYKPIVIKYGRFIPNELSHMDDTLGVELASPNQHAIRYENRNK